ncbi:MAG: lipoyl(octanoyl) transferase LipB [Candidatus Omnitrophica bacterium]|nr:lipoyl(octanoyl) transferase LipB [Candidatus Omnitrophota bacterium]
MNCEILDLGLIGYGDANLTQFKKMEEVKARVKDGVLILAEFFPVYTIGRLGSEANFLVSPEFLKKQGVECLRVTRGGDITFHNPGQLVVYPILDLSGLKRDIHWYLRSLEDVIIKTLLRCEIYAGRKPGYTGVWVSDEKIASIGIAVSKWVTCHGIALNVNNDLGFFDYINPCGIKGCRITSMASLNRGPVNMDEVKYRVIEEFEGVFGIKVTNAGIKASRMA